MQSQASRRREAFGSGQQSFSSSDWLRGSTSRYINFPGEIFFWLCLLNMEPLGICRFWEFMFYTWSHFFIPVVLFWQSAVFITLTWENRPLCSILSVLGRFVKRWAATFQLLLTLWKSDMAAHSLRPSTRKWRHETIPSQMRKYLSQWHLFRCPGLQQTLMSLSEVTHMYTDTRMLPGKASEKAGTRMTDPQAKEQRLQNSYLKFSRVWRGGLVVKSAGCSSRGHKFGCQHP